jgi:hypothetical protein
MAAMGTWLLMFAMTLERVLLLVIVIVVALFVIDALISGRRPR